MRTLLLPRNTGFEFGISAATQTAEFHFPNFVSALLSAALAMNPPNFFAELKRRNVFRVAGLYLVGAWLLIQVASTVLPTFDVPRLGAARTNHHARAWLRASAGAEHVGP